MKSNHIPRSERILAHILKLESKLWGTHVPIGKGNPYWKCTGCGLSDPEISIRGGHGKGCSVQGIKKEIEHYKRLLKEEEMPSVGA